jgi:hypothetical protein
MKRLASIENVEYIREDSRLYCVFKFSEDDDDNHNSAEIRVFIRADESTTLKEIERRANESLQKFVSNLKNEHM